MQNDILNIKHLVDRDFIKIQQTWRKRWNLRLEWLRRMKICNKKGFIGGVLWSILGSWILAIRVLKPESFLQEQIKDVVIALLLIMIGIGCVIRALSKKATQDEKLEELDERNQLIKLKTKSKSFQLTQGICFCLMLVFFVIGKVSGKDLCTSIGLGLGFAYSVSMFTELFTYFCYEKQN